MILDRERIWSLSDPERCDPDGGAMVSSPDGTWVRWADYEALLLTLDRLDRMALVGHAMNMEKRSTHFEVQSLRLQLDNSLRLKKAAIKKLRDLENWKRGYESA